MRHLFKTHLRTFLLSAFMVLSLATYAQQLHFIYIQADKNQPFSVQLNGKYFSSSSIGYIILPKLTDGTYTLGVNFAQNSYAEQTFKVNVAGKDYGYALKNFGDKGWGLFNYQTTETIMNNAATPQDSSQSGAVTNTSAFGSMLADVVNDKSINTLSKADTVTTADAGQAALPDNQSTTAAVSDTVAAALDTVTNTITQNEDAANATDTLNTRAAEDAVAEEDTTAFNTTGVIKAEENVDEKGTELTFIDFNSRHNDTIKAFIPSAEEKHQAAKRDTLDIVANAAAADGAKGKVNNPFFGQRNPGKDTAATTPNLIENDQPTGTTPVTKSLINTTCTDMLSDGDLNKLKKRIISKTDQNDILETVKKSLRNKCIATEQVKDLGNLFLNDDNRYGFYDAVYPFVYDYSSFASLENTLIDPNYKTRFKALLR